MLILISVILAAEPAWKTEEHRDGVLLESRPVSGSKFYEYRAQGEVNVDPASVCDSVFEWATSPKSAPEVKVRTILEDHGDRRVVHDRLEPAIVSRRMLTFSIRKERTANGGCSIESEVRNDKAPETPKGWVRMDKLKSLWRFDATGQGTRATFTLFVEPGGSVPAFLVHGTQRNTTKDMLKRALEHAKANAAATK